MGITTGKLDDTTPEKLAELHERKDIPHTPLDNTTYKYVLSFRSIHSPDMISFLKKIGDYIICSDRKGDITMINLNDKDSKMLRLCPISTRECPINDIFLYEDSDGLPIVVGCRNDTYGIWKYTEKSHNHWLSCYNDYDFPRKYGYKFKFNLTTNNRLVLITKKSTQYISFSKHGHGYRFILEDVPEQHFPLEFVHNNIIDLDSEKYRNIEKKLDVKSIPESDIENVAGRPYIDDNGKCRVMDEYMIRTIYSAYMYNDIMLVGQDWGWISVWQHI